MWTRIRFDIGWGDLAAGIVYCVFPFRRRSALLQARRAWSGREDFLITLSARSSFDLFLRALRLPEGSEILFSAITVPDMVRIAEAHGLVAVPVDTDKHGCLCLRSLKQRLSPQSRILVVAHLFGGYRQMDDVYGEVGSRDLLVVEDCAQQLRTVGQVGDSRSDLILYSFGPIKTSTALAGGVVTVCSPALRQQMAEILEQDPVQSRWRYGKRIVRFTLLKSLSGRFATRILRFLLNVCGRDFDSIANSLGRSFLSTSLVLELRRQPSGPLLRLLKRRWRNFDGSRIERRVALGRFLDRRIGIQRQPEHSYWVYPLFVKNPSEVRQRMLKAGFDATCRTRMAVVRATHETGDTRTASWCWDHVVILPWYPELPFQEVDRMARILNDLERE